MKVREEDYMSLPKVVVITLEIGSGFVFEMYAYKLVTEGADKHLPALKILLNVGF